MKSQLKEIKDSHEFGKGEGWELTILSEDIDWLIDQAEKVERYERALKFYANKENYEEWNENLGLTEYIHSVDFDGGDTAKKALEE